MPRFRWIELNSSRIIETEQLQSASPEASGVDRGRQMLPRASAKTSIGARSVSELLVPLAQPTTACGVPLRFRHSRLGDIRKWITKLAICL
jgi:hypothetical protein